ncbi:MAG: phage antirepressor KilAC domain-containing protein [Rhodoglobus sp.]
MTRPVLIYRWVGRQVRGRDIRVTVVDDLPLFAALDICSALNLRLEHDVDVFMGTDAPLFPLPTEQYDDVEYFTVDQVRELEADRPPYLVDDDFGDWFDDLLDSMSGDRLELLVEGALPHEPGRKAGESYSIRRAARILSRDPALNYGQKSLFATLEAYAGWLARENGIWVPAAEAIKAGYLIRLQRWIPGKKIPYPQVRITPDGIRYLHTRLGGVATLNLDDVPALTLVDL